MCPHERRSVSGVAPRGLHMSYSVSKPHRRSWMLGIAFLTGGLVRVALAQAVALPGGVAFPGGWSGGLGGVKLLGQSGAGGKPATAAVPGLAPQGSPPGNLGQIFGSRAIGRTAVFQFGLTLGRDLIEDGKLDTPQLQEYVASPDGLIKDTAVSTGASFLSSLVPAGPVTRALASGVAKTGLRWATGEREDPAYLTIGSLGALAGSFALRKLPGGAFIGGLLGQLGAEKSYLEAKPHLPVLKDITRPEVGTD